MTAANFAPALAAVLVYEGAESNNPKDPGGRTNQGVTQRVFGAWLTGQGKPARDVYTMMPAERDAIYRRQYWDAIRGDELPAGVDLVLFDCAVNSGVSRAIMWLQRALRVGVDGHFGTATKAALDACPDYDALIGDILDRRMAFLRALRTFSTFGRGWTNRVNHVRQLGQAWATGSVGQQPVYFLGGEAKANVADARRPPPRAPADAVAAGGTVSTGISTVQTTLQPLQGTPWVDRVLVILIAVGAIATVLGLVYGQYARARKRELEDALDLATPGRPAPANDNDAAADDAEKAA